MVNRRILVLLVLAILGMFVTHASGAVTNVFIERIEVTQAVQCLDVKNGYTKCPDNSLELDSDRAVAVRVYIGHQGAPVCPSGNSYEPVSELKKTKVKLWWAAAHAPNYIWPLGYTDEKTFDVPCSKDLKDLRDDEKGSATFIIPAAKLGKPRFEKALRVEAEVVPPAGVQDSPTSDNKKMIQLGHEDDQGNDLPGGLFPPQVLSVVWLPIDYRPNASTQYDPYTGPPWMTDFTKPAKDVVYMKALYPVPVDFDGVKGFIVYGSHPTTGAKCSKCPDIRDEGAGSVLTDKVAKARTYLKPRPDVLVGYLPDQAIGACRGKGKNSGGVWINGCSSQSTEQVILAHEVGHGVDVWHTSDNAPDGEPCWPFPGKSAIEEAGYSFLTKKVVSSQTGDFMEPPASGSEWISPYMWNRFLDKPLSKEWSTCDATSSKAASSSQGAAGPVIVIGGRILNGNGELDPLFVFTGEGPFPTSDTGAPYCVDLETSGGSSLSTYCFDLPKTRDALDADSLGEGFSFLLPFPPSTARVVLRHGATMLDQRTVSPNAPDLTVDEPGAGDVDPDEVSWTASDVDGDDLTFTVLYSTDGGTSLFPIAIDMETTGPTAGLEIDSNLMAGGSSALFRVLASDGFNTTTVDSARFEITPKPPTVVIHAPENGARINFAEDLILAGYGSDLEDGELTGSSLQWGSSHDGFLGEGSHVVLPPETLTPGQHEITLVATDSDGMTALASVTVSVFLPVEIDIKPFSYPNSIKLKNKGVVPVAVCNGGPVTNGVTLDRPAEPDGFSGGATNIDTSTLEFALDSNGAPLGASTAMPKHDLSDAGVLGEHLTEFVDTDSDGAPDTLVYLDAPNCAGAPDGPDLVVHFPRGEIGLAEGDTEACVEAMLSDGVLIIGCDTVRVLN
jgi:hypothetical protein